MCGIAGYKLNKPISHLILDHMLHALQHRGPDDHSVYHSNIFNGGMTRLAINGIMDGKQPLYSKDNDIVVFYNGEIYNSPTLRRELEAKGYHFKTKTDGEVIGHLYHEETESAFEKLDGMFAIALWIESEKKLILARDFAGEKPLYYRKISDTEIVFASEIKALKAFTGLNLSLNKQSMWDFATFLWVPEPETIYNEIKAIPRGSFLTIDASGIKIKSFPNRFYNSCLLDKENVEDEIIIEEVRRVVTEAVESRLLSDVPIGCFLSGGLDSSIVTTLAKRKLNNLTTFSVGFEDIVDPYHGNADESKEALEYANMLGTNHYTINVRANDFRLLLNDFCKFGDQPFAVSSGLGILAIARKANELGLKVLLSGDGADECFGGYSWYPYLQANSNLVYDEDEKAIVSFQNFGLEFRKRIDIISQYPAHKQAWAWHYYAHESEKTALFSEDYMYGTLSSLKHFTAFKSENHWTPEDYIKHDRQFYFPNEMLRKLDRMTMAYSVEGRVPFAAPSVLALADKLKYEHMIKTGTLKWVLRQAFNATLPSKIINRKKHGFNVPIDHWLQGEWQELFEEAFSLESKLSKMNIIHKNSRKVAIKLLEDKKRLNGHTIFCYIMLNQWLEHHFDGNYC